MKRRAGFSLIEVMIAVIIFAIAAVASLEFFRHCHESFLQKDKLRLQAFYAAAASLESLYWEDLDSSSLNPTGGWIGLAAPGGSLANVNAKRDYSIETRNSGLDTEYKVIRTRVSWD